MSTKGQRNRSAARGVLPAMLLLSACFDYRETSPAQIPPATTVRVVLTDQGTADMAPALGQSVATLEGNVREASADRLVLSVTKVSRRGDQTVDWNGSVVTLASNDVRSVGVRTLNKKRSWLAGGGLVAAIVGGVIAISKATGKASGDPGKTEPPPF